MAKEDTLASAKAFPVMEGNLSLWVFKKNASGFSARSVNITDALGAALRNIVIARLARTTEVDEYDLLAQTNEVSCLHLESDETIFDSLKDLVDRPAAENGITSTKQLDNSAGYLVRLRQGDQVLYCVKKVSDAWVARKAINFLNVVVVGANQLDLVDGRTLTISNDFDFIAVDTGILILKKSAFESLLSYRLTYQNSFANLQQSPAFSQVFVDLAPLIAHVGTNTMHLRRMAVIEQRGHYADPLYMARLRQVNDQKQWGIAFDPQGRIIATEESLRTIMQVLLNHRLYSELSLGTFDVPSAAQVGGI